MTTEEFIAMAIEAGFDTGKMIVHDYEVDWVWPKDHPRKSCNYQLIKFAELVRLKEREACAEICDLYDASHPSALASAIRLRSAKGE